ALRILYDVYEDFALNVLAMPVMVGRKTERERFAGADATYTIEGMMGDGKALQMGTSHELGQNFAKAFDITFQSGPGPREHAWQTSWGVSTRLVGALIMGHGDDAGLRLPPRIAPVQVVVIVVRQGDGVGERAGALVAELAASGIRAHLDARVDTGFGRRAVEWEVKGVPVRVELGPRDVAAGSATLVRRDRPGKTAVSLDGLVKRVRDLLDDIQTELAAQARAYRDAHIMEVAGADGVAEAVAAGGFARTGWSSLRDREVELANLGLTVRCLQRQDGSIPTSSMEDDLVATVAKAY
ncbi:MAG: His/Gly/Thr/Pro-type tRNA ligase C-terminal domain-containing protein, partial [Pseudonocardiaceae bacterium]